MYQFPLGLLWASPVWRPQDHQQDPRDHEATPCHDTDQDNEEGPACSWSWWGLARGLPRNRVVIARGLGVLMYALMLQSRWEFITPLNQKHVRAKSPGMTFDTYPPMRPRPRPRGPHLRSTSSSSSSSSSLSPPPSSSSSVVRGHRRRHRRRSSPSPPPQTPRSNSMANAMPSSQRICPKY
jgi:hypothetical protein